MFEHHLILLLALFENSERLLPDSERLLKNEEPLYGSCNKTRSPFQAQITKIMVPDYVYSNSKLGRIFLIFTSKTIF